jgi:hypothetical protein
MSKIADEICEVEDCNRKDVKECVCGCYHCPDHPHVPNPSKWKGEVYVGRLDHTWYTIQMESSCASEADADQDMIDQVIESIEGIVAFVGIYHVEPIEQTNG